MITHFLGCPVENLFKEPKHFHIRRGRPLRRRR
jgi:hypothetical protein